MDSGNSGGSLQSSSDAEDDYESRSAVDSFSDFFTGGLGPNPPTQVSAPSFDPFSNFFHPNVVLPGSGSQAPRSNPNTLNPLLPGSPVFTLPELPPPPPPPQIQNPAAARNPRKRSRASRRAPTTVLTTDTTNFRAMVQEFTGIPSPPFSNSPFARTRFDPTGTMFTSLDVAAAGSGGLQPPPYLRRPFAQKIQSPLPFLASSSSLLTPPSAPVSAAAAIDTCAAAIQSPTTPNQIPQINFQFPLSNPNPILQINPKYPNPPNPPPIDHPKPQSNSFDDLFINLGPGNTSDLTRWTPHDPSFTFRANPKSPENKDTGAGTAAARGEALVESSWICSSSE